MAFLGFDRPRDIRKIVERHDGALGPRATVARVINGGEAKEQWLTEHQATYVIAKCETPVAINAGEWGGTYRTLVAEVHYVTPAEWKGQLPKDIHHARVWAALTSYPPLSKSRMPTRPRSDRPMTWRWRCSST